LTVTIYNRRGRGKGRPTIQVLLVNKPNKVFTPGKEEKGGGEERKKKYVSPSHFVQTTSLRREKKGGGGEKGSLALSVRHQQEMERGKISEEGKGECSDQLHLITPVLDKLLSEKKKEWEGERAKVSTFSLFISGVVVGRQRKTSIPLLDTFGKGKRRTRKKNERSET